MTITTANLDITTDTFGTWVTKTNSLAYNMTTHVVTVDGTATGNTSTGNGTIIGRFGANTLFATAALRGGNVSTTDTLTISSNLSISNTATISGALTLSNTLNATGVATFVNAVANVITSNSVAVGGASINSTAFIVTGSGGTVTAVANSSVARIVVGNSVVNSTYVSSNNGYFSGNLVVDGVFTTTSDLSVAGDLIPPVTSTYDLGNTISTFRNGYFTLIDATNLDASNSVTIGTTVVNSTVLQSSSLFTVNTTSNTVGAARFSNTVTILGNTAANTLSATGATTISNTLNVTGLTTANDINAATANTTAINVGANVNITTASITIGNSSVNTFANSTALDIDGTLAVLNSVSFSNTFSVTGLSTLGAVNATTANATGINVGANVNITTAQIKVGNTTANVTVSNNSINVNGATVNSTVYTGSANNATFLATQPASYYTNATNLATGTVPTARLGSGAADATTFLRGDQSYSTAVTSVTSGVGLTGSVTTTGSLAVNANNGIVANSTGVFADAKTGLVANTTGLYVNASYIATISSNNASFLNGQAASFYTNATNLSTGTVPTGRLTGTYSISIDGSANSSLYSNSSVSNTFTVGSATYFVSNGAILSGTSTTIGSGAQLQLSGNNGVGGTNIHTFLAVQGTGATNGKKYFRINSSGALEIINDAYNSAIFTMDNSGNFTASSNITAYSDIRLKTNIHPIKNALNLVDRMSGVYYNRLSDEKRKIGFIAQDLLRILPEVVHENENGYYSVDYGNITSLLIEAVKELNVRVRELEARVK